MQLLQEINSSTSGSVAADIIEPRRNESLAELVKPVERERCYATPPECKLHVRISWDIGISGFERFNVRTIGNRPIKFIRKKLKCYKNI